MYMYPLTFKPRLVEKMWGGRKLETVLGKALPPDKPIGESWEIFDFPPGVVDSSSDWVSSIVSNGPLAGMTLHKLMTEHRQELLGDVSPSGSHWQFPLLVKYLDARQDLSVQVHPDQTYAATHPGAHLKSEAWYVVQRDPGARLLKGLSPGQGKASFAQAIASGQVEQAIASIPVDKGHSHYLPSGTVHAMGAGILAAEVQTPSDTTYRVYDFERVDPSTGKLRTLHVEQAMACIDFINSPPPAVTDQSTQLVRNEFFGMDRVTGVGGETIELVPGRPRIWMILDGSVSIRLDDGEYAFNKGQTILLPAGMGKGRATVTHDLLLLDVTFPSPFSD